jgi:hypothetical protein
MIDLSTGGFSSAGGRVVVVLVVVEVAAVDAFADRVGWVVVDEFAAGFTICAGSVVAGEPAFGDEVVDVVLDEELVVDDVLDVVDGANVVVVDVVVDVVLVVVVDVVVEVELVVVVAEPIPRSSDALSTIGPRFPSVISPATPLMLIMMLLMLDHDAHVDCSETLTVLNDVDVSDAVGPCWYIFATQLLLPYRNSVTVTESVAEVPRY